MPAHIPARLLAASVLVASAAAAAAQDPIRTVEGQHVTSSALPRLRIEVKPPFRFLGRVPFTLGADAAGERIVFADVDGREIRRMFVLQFEGFLPQSSQIYRYDFSKAPEMVGHRWRSNAFAYGVPALLQNEDASEAAVMHRWLAERGYRAADVQLMYRYLTLGDERRKQELILFYLEGDGDASWLREMNSGTARWRTKAAELEARSLDAFVVLRYPGK